MFRRPLVICIQYKHIKGKHNVIADCLMQIGNEDKCENESHNKIYFANIEIPIDNNQIMLETAKDPILSQVIRFIHTAWPCSISDEIKPFYNRKNDLEVVNQCLFWNQGIVIPKMLQNQVLKELHATHEGIVRTKSLAQSYLWFPGLDKKNEEICKSCNHCLLVRAAPPRCIVNWPSSEEPFYTIHADFFSLSNHQFLVIVDSYTKWPEVYVTKNITSTDLVNKLRECFARFGLPHTLVSDNGPSCRRK